MNRRLGKRQRVRGLPHRVLLVCDEVHGRFEPHVAVVVRRWGRLHRDWRRRCGRRGERLRRAVLHWRRRRRRRRCELDGKVRGGWRVSSGGGVARGKQVQKFHDIGGMKSGDWERYVRRDGGKAGVAREEIGEG